MNTITRGIFLFLFYIILLPGCKSDTNNPEDQSYILKGYVTNSITQKGVTNVMVGIKNPSVPDSTVFKGDSLNQYANNAFLIVSMSDINGLYELSWFLGGRDTSLYKNIFAYKSGYKLWRYTQNSGNSISRLDDYRDELNISLHPK